MDKEEDLRILVWAVAGHRHRYDKIVDSDSNRFVPQFKKVQGGTYQMTVNDCEGLVETWEFYRPKNIRLDYLFEQADAEFEAETEREAVSQMKPFRF